MIKMIFQYQFLHGSRLIENNEILPKVWIFIYNDEENNNKD